MIVAIIILCLLLILVGVLVYLQFRGPEKAKDLDIDGNAPGRQQQLK
jgi:hypothetical protein